MLCAEVPLKGAEAGAPASDPAGSTLICAALPSCLVWQALQLARVLACSSRCIVWRQSTCIERHLNNHHHFWQVADTCAAQSTGSFGATEVCQ